MHACLISSIKEKTMLRNLPLSRFSSICVRLSYSAMLYCWLSLANSGRNSIRAYKPKADSFQHIEEIIITIPLQLHCYANHV